MTTQQIIEKAIEAGYLGGKSFAHYRKKSNLIVYEIEDYVTPKPIKTISEALLDPQFWKSLAIGMKWQKYTWISWKDSWCELHQTQATNDEDFSPNWPNGSRNYTWVHQWHRFIQHLADGKDEDSFFKSFNL
jgi:hypothetical protein